MIPGRSPGRGLLVLDRVVSGFLLWLCICLHDTTRKFHTGKSHTGASSPRFIYRSENFMPARNPATVSCKRGTTTRLGLNLTSGWTGTGSACVNFVNPKWHLLINVKCAFIQTRYKVNYASCEHDTKSSSHPGIELAPRRIFSCKQPQIFT